MTGGILSLPAIRLLAASTVALLTVSVAGTGIAVSFPNDCYARVAPRSGLAAKHAIDVLAGVVDCTYTNQIKVVLFNHGKNEFDVNVGDRIAQLIFERIYIPIADDVKTVAYDELLTQVQSKLVGGTRGLAGFGSTDVANS